MKNKIEYCFEFIDLTFPALIFIPNIYILVGQGVSGLESWFLYLKEIVIFNPLIDFILIVLILLLLMFASKTLPHNLKGLFLKLLYTVTSIILYQKMGTFIAFWGDGR